MLARRFHNPSLAALAVVASACGATMMAGSAPPKSKDEDPKPPQDTTQPGLTKTPTTAEIAEMDVDELKEEATRRGISVMPSGEDDEPSLGDYRRALAPRDDHAAASIRLAESRAAKLDHTIPGGKYARADGTLVNSYDQPIDAKGNLKDKNERSKVQTASRFS
jgi:hypothetical protein